MFSDKKISEFTNPVSKLDDQPQMSAQTLKAWFDSSVEEVREKFNALVDELSGFTDGALNGVAYSPENGKLLFNLGNGTTEEIDLPLELLVKSGHYNAETRNIELLLANGDKLQIPAGDLVDEYAADEKTINMVASEGIKTFTVKDGVFLKDAASDNGLYLRKNGAWYKLQHTENLGDLGLVRLNKQSKGLIIETDDTTGEPFLAIREAKTDNIKGHSTERVLIKPCFMPCAISQYTHQEMSDAYDTDTMDVHASMEVYRKKLPVSYEAAKNYIDEKMTGVTLITGASSDGGILAVGEIKEIAVSPTAYRKFYISNGECEVYSVSFKLTKADGTAFSSLSWSRAGMGITDAINTSEITFSEGILTIPVPFGDLAIEMYLRDEGTRCVCYMQIERWAS